MSYFCCLNTRCNAVLKEKRGRGKNQKYSSVTSTAEVRAGICPRATAVSVYYVHVCILFLLLLFQVNVIFQMPELQEHLFPDKTLNSQLAPRICLVSSNHVVTPLIFAGRMTLGSLSQF